MSKRKLRSDDEIGYRDAETRPEKVRKPKISLLAFNALHRINIPSYTSLEELLNALSHGVGALLAAAALVLCCARGAKEGDVWYTVAGAVYGASLIFLYLMSCLYHALPVCRGKLVFRVIDHCSIFLLIAGTYTPYTLVSLRGYSPALGWTLFGMVWLAAVVGIALNAVDLMRFKKASVFAYIACGWVIVFAFRPMTAVIEPPGIALLLIGGVLYTVGAALYAVGKRKRYAHSVFHVFVLAGSVLHFFSIYLYVR